MARLRGTRYIRILEEGDGQKIVHMLIRTRAGSYSAMYPLLPGKDIAGALESYLNECAFQGLEQRTHGLLTQEDLDLAGVSIKDQ
jgi:hypothetical protein